MDSYIATLNLTEYAVARENQAASASAVAYISPNGNFYVTDDEIDMAYARKARMIFKKAA